MPTGILCAGRIYCDLIFTGLDGPPRTGAEAFADGLAIRAGGGAYITAAYLAALARPVTLMGSLPAAPFAQTVIAEMARNKVAAFCADAEGPDPQITVAFADRDDRGFLTHRTGAAISPRLIAELPAARHLHIGEITTALEHPELLRRARVAGMTISLDCGWDAAALARSDLGACIAAVDVFLPNETEAEALQANDVIIAPRAVTVIKKGAEGAMAKAGTGDWVTARAEAVPVRDCTGAGDAFNAGFIHAWLHGATLDAALSLGNACGGIAVGRVGGAGTLPDLAYLAPKPRSAEAVK